MWCNSKLGLMRLGFGELKRQLIDVDVDERYHFIVLLVNSIAVRSGSEFTFSVVSVFKSVRSDHSSNSFGWDMIWAVYRNCYSYDQSL